MTNTNLTHTDAIIEVMRQAEKLGVGIPSCITTHCSARDMDTPPCAIITLAFYFYVHMTWHTDGRGEIRLCATIGRTRTMYDTIRAWDGITGANIGAAIRSIRRRLAIERRKAERVRITT